MNKTNKRVDTVMALHDHPKEDYMDCGVPILHEATQGTKAVQFMAKEVVCTTPTHDCAEWARGEPGGWTELTTEGVRVNGRTEFVFRYDEGGDQICTNCGYVRNDRPDVVHDHQHAGRYDGFDSQPAKAGN